MLNDIYRSQPWNVRPDLQDSAIGDLATKLIASLGGIGPTVFNFDLVPNFMVELDYTDQVREHLGRGLLPEDATVSGSQSWKTLFGKIPDTGAWTWSELVSDWENRTLYEFEIATMISDAVERDAPRGCYLRRSNDLVIYRLSLRRFERVLNSKTNRFYFTAAPMDVEVYWLPQESHDNLETKLFHLVNISWLV